MTEPPPERLYAPCVRICTDLSAEKRAGDAKNRASTQKRSQIHQWNQRILASFWRNALFRVGLGDRVGQNRSVGMGAWPGGYTLLAYDVQEVPADRAPIAITLPSRACRRGGNRSRHCACPPRPREPRPSSRRRAGDPTCRQLLAFPGDPVEIGLRLRIAGIELRQLLRNRAGTAIERRRLRRFAEARHMR